MKAKAGFRSMLTSRAQALLFEPCGLPSSLLTSFEEVRVQHIAKGLQHESKHFDKLDAQLQEYSAKLQEALNNTLCAFEGHTHGVADTLKETLSRAREVQEQIDEFNLRVNEALKRALKFNDLVRKQEDYPSNLLPPEMYENSGAVVAHLERARALGRNLLKKDAAELVKVAKRVKLMYASVPGSLAVAPLLDATSGLGAQQWRCAVGCPPGSSRQADRGRSCNGASASSAPPEPCERRRARHCRVGAFL